MPMYEYSCEECGKKFQFFQKSMQSEKKQSCPDCGSSNVRKLISSFSPGSDTSSADSVSCPTGTCPFS
ncbi:putative regulatory protein, FmdB family [Sedimentisphaera cyanobacteriorum]|uniref:Putative regulatory protein, FmdB family n=1 Tax=Sedimentisphaera cyanobacteriorum TaxID=1940790 RepID=A0A1Q2HMS1_9BACT|nr:zinc ribbon domain-containing protein [Sedimentisphaera cyanobacteriorum]AQQ08516.1 putative regulatory protein, FmdB family [Sedimentisphaera cyanobacteriorum]